MKRYEVLEIRGKRFALALTLASEEQIAETFGLDEIKLDEIFAGNIGRKKITDNTLKAFEILATEGAEYAQIYEEKEFDRPDMKELKHFLKTGDILDLRIAVINAFTLGWKRDIELAEDEEKNGESPAG